MSDAKRDLQESIKAQLTERGLYGPMLKNLEGRGVREDVFLSDVNKSIEYMLELWSKDVPQKGTGEAMYDASVSDQDAEYQYSRTTSLDEKARELADKVKGKAKEVYGKRGEIGERVLHGAESAYETAAKVASDVSESQIAKDAKAAAGKGYGKLKGLWDKIVDKKKE